MREIPLTRGMVAFVDDVDYESLSPNRWHVLQSRNRLYASRCIYPNGRYGKRVEILMHRVVCGAHPGFLVDHVNGNTLDNRRCNVRVATPTQNGWNRGANKNNRIGLKGASFHRGSNTWRAQISVGGRNRCLGCFSTPQEAHAAYCAAAIALHGEFARTA